MSMSTFIEYSSQDSMVYIWYVFPPPGFHVIEKYMYLQ